MTDKPRKQESLIKSNAHGSPGPGSQMQAGMMPHPFDGSLQMPTPHPLAYGIMHPSLGVGGLSRGHSSVSNDMGPPIFMPSLNLGVPRQQQTSISPQPFTSKQPKNPLTQPPIMATSFMPDLSFQGQSLLFHPSQVRQAQPSYLSPSPPLNMKQQPSNMVTAQSTKLPHTKSAPTSKGVQGEYTRAANNMRSSGPKQTASSPSSQLHHGVIMSSAMSRPSMAKGDPPADQVTYVLSPTHMGVHGNYLISHQIAPNQKGSTLSKMLMTPTQQQNSVISSTGRQRNEQEMEVGGTYVSHVTTPRTSVPATSSLVHGSHSGAVPHRVGSFTSTIPDGPTGHGSLSDHATHPFATSGQPSSVASFMDTKNDRPPQPSAVGSPTSQPPTNFNKERNVTTDGMPNIIIKGSNLSGRHIAAITNNTTLQHTGSGAIQPAYVSNSQTDLPQTVESYIKSEYGHVPTADTGWPHPHDHSPGTTQGNSGQMFGNVIHPQVNSKHVQQTSMSGSVVPTSSTPVTLGMHTHSPGGSNLSSPGGPSHLPNLQGVGSSPRPQILKKRPLDGGWRENHPGAPIPSGNNSLKQEGVADYPPVPLSPVSEGGVVPLNHSGVRPEVNDFSTSPRKKPRKQNVIANEDQYASNVPDSLSSSSASSLDTTASGEGSEESGRSLMNSVPINTGGRMKDGTQVTKCWDLEVRYLSQLRKSPYPICNVYKVCHKAAHNHFKQHSDIKHKEEIVPTAVQLASDRYVYQRAGGWRVYHVLSQLNEMARMEKELSEQVLLLREAIVDMDKSDSCHVGSNFINNFKELIECNLVRSTRILTHLENTKTQTLQIFDHHPQVVELLQKCSPQPAISCPVTLSQTTSLS